MSDSLLDSLRTGGARISRGGFTLDRAKAREKLSKFQLVDPHHYVLEFVQAAYLLDASFVDIELDTDEMHMTFDGQLFGRRELENLYRASFSKADTTKLRALRHIAIGVTAAWALDPAVFFIDVDDGDVRLRLHLSRDGDDEIEEARSHGEKRTKIYLCESARFGHILEHFRYLTGELSEMVALRDYCAHADIPVLVNGDSVSRGHKLRDRARGVVRIDTPHEKGRLGVTMDAGLVPTNIQVLTNGVLASEIHGSEVPFGFDAIIDSNRLDKGLSQSEIVRNDTWKHVRDVVIREAVYRSLATFVGELDDVTAATHAVTLRDAAGWLWSLDEEQSSEAASRSLRAAKRALRTARIWKYAHRSPEDTRISRKTPLASLIDIDQSLQGEAVPASSMSIRDTHAQGIPTAVNVVPKYRHVFEREFGARLRDVTSEIKQAMERIERIHEFARRGQPRQPDPNYFLAHRLVEDGDFRAFLGIRVGDRKADLDGTVKWTGQKLVLHERDIGLAYPNLHIWINGPLLFRMDAPHFTVSKPYVDLVDAILAELPQLIRDTIERMPPHMVIEWLRSLTSHDELRRLAQELETPPQRIDEIAEAHARRADSLWFDYAEAPAPSSQAAIAARVEALGDLAEVPTIEIGLERRVSLAELLEIRRREGRLVRAARVFPQLSGPLAITGGRREVDLVERIFGRLVDADAQGEHSVLNALESLPPSAPVGEQSDRDLPGSDPPEHDVREAAADRAESMLLELEAPPEPDLAPAKTEAEEPKARFLDSLERTFSTSAASWQAHEVVMERRPGSPAAVLEATTCVVNEAHPIISAAADHPASDRHQHWAETAVWTAIAAGGTRSDREFAFGHLADLVDRA